MSNEKAMDIILEMAKIARDNNFVPKYASIPEMDDAFEYAEGFALILAGYDE